MHNDEYRVQCYFPVLDSFLAEISRRFDDKNLSIMKAIQACHPSSKTTDSLQALIIGYDIPATTIEMEATLAKTTLVNINLNGISDILLSLKPLSAAFQNLVRLIRIAMTIAVSTAQC